MVKVIRFANEGFKNHKHKIQINNEDVEIEGCYVFIDKVIKKALKYDKYILKTTKENIKNRDKDIKHEAVINDECFIYARLIDPDNLRYTVDNNAVCVQPELLGNDIDEKNMRKITIKEFYDNVKKYKEFQGKLRKIAKEKGIKQCYFNSEYYMFEAIVNANDIKDIKSM